MADENAQPSADVPVDPPVDESLEPEANLTAPELPSPDDFDSYDEVDSTVGQLELPVDSFDEAADSDAEPDEDGGCCV